MSRTFIVDGVGREWSVDADAMYALVRANIGAEEIRRRTTKAMPVRHVFGPDVFSTTTDWNGFRAALNDQSERWWKETRLRLSNLPGEQVVQELILMREDSANRTREVLDLQTDAQHKTMTSIHDSVGVGEAAVKVATVVRDASAMTLVVVGSGGTGALAGGLVTSGQAFGVLAAGSVLKGIYNYEDNGKVGGAVLEASSTFVISCVGLAGEAGEVAGLIRKGGSQAAKYLLIGIGATLDGVMEGGKAIVDGQSAKTALWRAAARVGIDVVASNLPLDSLAMKVAIGVGIGVGADTGVGAIKARPPSSGALHRAGPMLEAMPPVTHGLSFAAGGQTLSDEKYVRENVLTRVG